MNQEINEPIMNQELNEMEHKPNMLAFQVAIIFSFYSIVLLVIQKAMGFMATPESMSGGKQIIWGVLSYLPFIFGIVYVIKKHKTDLGGYITFSRAFSAGFKTAFYTGMILAILMFLYYKVFDPSAYTLMIENAKEKAISQSNGDARAEQGFDMMVPYMIYFIMFTAAITYTLFGLIVSLIGASIFKSQKPLHLN